MSLTSLQRLFKERSWFSGLLDKSKFIPNDKPQSADFQKIETVVNSTDKIDTYDLAFNVQMPSLANAPFFSYTKNKSAVDYYCNNKIHIRLYFKDENIFNTDSSPVCIITPQIYSGTTSTKSDGIYFSTVYDVRDKVDDAIESAIEEGDVGKQNNRTGPFAKSENGVNADNIVEKLKQSNYLDKLVEYTGKKLEAGSNTSPFKVYNTRYRKDKIDDGVLISETNHMNTEEKSRYFDTNFQYYIQFDFNLNEYTVEREKPTQQQSDNGKKGTIKKIIKKTHESNRPGQDSTASYDTDDSLILLLNKNQWFSVVFQNINIPFDIKQIPKDMVKIEFQIDNITPPDAIGSANLFYRNFFCEFLDMTLKLYNKLPIKVHDVMFQYEDMLRAIKLKSKNYFSKISQLNYLARRVLYYYLKDINETKENHYTNFYAQMENGILKAKNATQEIINGSSVVKNTLMTELKSSVETANSEIKEFSNFFKRDNIKGFRKTFLQALMRADGITGLSKLTDQDIIDQLAKIKNFKSDAKPGVELPEVSQKRPTSPGTLFNKDTITTIGNPSPRDSNLVEGVEVGGSVVEYQIGGDSVAEYQAGGGAELFQSEDYNLMIPMDIRTPGTGINDMTVRIHKIHLEQAWAGETQQMDNKTSVDIQVGDAIRFVYDDNIIYAIVCGFKPGKPLNKDSSDQNIGITQFRTEYMRISSTFETQDLKLSPEEFLSLTNMRGIKFLPFKYNDESYSFAPYDSQPSLLKARNESVKKGLNGKFVFSCKDEKIPILPNGYKLPFISRAKEGIKSVLSKINPFSTDVDIGNDNSLPQYSLPSYMTLEKVLVPPNFSEVVKLLKDFRGDNPDSILSKLIKIMETNGINDSNDCKKTSDKVAASDFENRKKYFQEELNRTRSLFTKNYVKTGKIIDRRGAIQYIKNLYNQQVKPGVFVDNNGNSMRISTKLVYALDLIPNDPIRSMNILIRALSQEDVPTILDRKKKLSEKILTSEETEMNAAKEDLIDNEGGGGVQYGGAEDKSKAEQIIKDTVNLLHKQNFIDEKKKDTFVTNLESAEATYDPNEKEPTDASSTSMVKSGLANKFGFGSGSGSGFLANMFNKGLKGSSASSSGMGSDSCGNNTSIVCNGEDLVVTVTLKLNELIASCMNPEMIQHLGSHPSNLIMNGENGGGNDDTSPFSAAAAAPPPPAPSQSIVSSSSPSSSSAAAPPPPAPSQSSSDPPSSSSSTSSKDASPPAPKDAAPLAPKDAAVAPNADMDKVIDETMKLMPKLEELVKSRNESHERTKKKIDDEIAKIIKPEINSRIVTELKAFSEKPKSEGVDDKSGIRKIVETNYGEIIDKNIPTLEKIVKELVENLAKQLKENKEQIDTFDKNVTQIEKYIETQKNAKTEEFYKKANTFRTLPETKELIEFANNPPVDAVNVEQIKTHVFSVIVNSIEEDVLNKEGKESKVYILLKGVPDDNLKVDAGGNNNNSKSKKNKKSNKNKTKKRKGKSSSSRKFKFAKVKKV